MPAGVSAYTALANVTLGSSANSVEFSSISGIYRDLILVLDGLTVTDTGNFRMRLNGLSTTIYNLVLAEGNGSSTYSTNDTNDNKFNLNSSSLALNTRGQITVNLMDYSATDKHKNILVRSNQAASQTTMTAGRFASTSAITSILIYNLSPANFGATSTFALYGVSA
jgi:hypothetical protein